MLGKKHRESFPKGVTYRTKQPPEVVHTHLFGPIRTQSIGGVVTSSLSLMNIVERLGFTC